MLREPTTREYTYPTPGGAIPPSAAPEPDDEAPIGHLGRYEVLRLIGRGGMSQVYKARHAKLGMNVALKIIDEDHAADPEYGRRLLNEARAMAGMDHRNVARVFDCDEALPDPPDLFGGTAPGGEPRRVLFIAEEYLPGEDLNQVIRQGPLRLDRVLHLAIQITAGLEAAHRKGVIHRDLKPANVRVLARDRVKLIDFGLARSRTPSASFGDPSTTRPGTTVGTLLYMSPEQIQGQRLDERSDLFSLGVVLYEMVAGRPPFPGQGLWEVGHAILNDAPHPLSRYAGGVPPELERIVSKLLAKRPGQRYQSAHEVLTDLRTLARTTTPRFPMPFVLHPALRRATAAAALALVAGAVGWFVFHPRGAPVPKRTNVAVVDFANLTGDDGLDYLGKGFAADLTSELVQRKGLQVTRSDVRDEQGRPVEEPKRLGHDLGVGTIIRGAVRPAGSDLRLDLQLVDARSGFIRQSSGFPFDIAAAPLLRRRIADQVATWLGVPARAAPAPASDIVPGAYEDYLRGLAHLNSPDDPAARDQAAETLRRAVNADPTFALAWGAYARAVLWQYNRDHEPAQLANAKTAADEAVKLGPQLAQTHIDRAGVYRQASGEEQAVRDLTVALGMNPDQDDALIQLGQCYRKLGDMDRAEQAMRDATRVRPGWWKTWSALGGLLQRRGDLAGAEEAWKQLIRVAPKINRGYEMLAACYAEQGKLDQAIAEYARMPNPDEINATTAGNMGTVYFRKGMYAEALAMFLRASALEPNNKLARCSLGDTYVQLGRPGEAREAYVEGVRLAAVDVEGDSTSAIKRAWYIVLLAKSGDCAAASGQMDRYGPGMPQEDAEALRQIAFAYSLCGRPDEAIATIRRLISLGITPGPLLAEKEFDPLRGEPRFQTLATGKGGG